MTTMASGDFGYTAHDVAQALARLSQVTAAHGLSFAEGTPAVLEPQDVLARWQAVSTVAGTGDGTLDATTLEHLRAIYSYIEAVIISCGAPDTFDVYEACFESLSKAGLYLRGVPSRQLLLQVLEDVHEVYDVLLSCVETYEWVQPGATGMLRLWMMQVLFASFGSQTISGRDLMELTDNDVCGSISLIAFILRCEQAPYEMQAAAGRCLVELTTADCVFFVKSAETEDWQSQQIAKLTSMLNRHVNGLIRGIIQFEIVEAFGHCICQHQLSHARTDVIVKYFLTTIHNCLLYCSENQKKLRQHLATQSTIVQDIMIPYVYNILPALYDKPHCGPNEAEWQNLKSTLQTFVVVTFNINVFRPQLRDSDMLCKVCEVPNILTHISMLELLIKVCINVDYVKGPHADILLSIIHSAFERLPPESRERLQRRMTSEQGLRLPYSRSAAQAVQTLAFALTPPAGDAHQNTEEKKARRKNNWRSAKNKARKRKRMFGMQGKGKGMAAFAALGGGGDADEEGESEDDEDDMPPLMPAENWESSLGQTDETGVPSMAKCQLSGGLMHDPVRTPDGYLFERAVLEDWMQQHPSNPLTGQPLSLGDVASATEVASFIQGYQLQMLSACAIAPEAFEEPPQPQVAVPTPVVHMPAPEPMPAPAPASPSGLASLGDLPSLNKDQASTRKKKEKAKIHITSRSVVDCPDDMRCALDGKVMTNPLRSPYGHCFEKKTLERWVMNCGSVCPITQQPLRIEDCGPDSEMKKRIVKFLKGQ